MIYEHAHPYTFLIPRLKSHLPNSGPLLRRIQYELGHVCPTAHVLATFPPSSTLKSPVQENNQGEEQDEPWIAAYVDLYQGRETQVWLFSTLELPSTDKESAKRATTNQLRELFIRIREEYVPSYIASLTPTDLVDATTTITHQHQIKPHPPTAFLIGSLQTDLLALILDLTKTLQRPKLRVLRGQDVSYVKYCFPLSTPRSTSTSLSSVTSRGGSGNGTSNRLPPGYRFHDRTGKYGLQPHQTELVISRTHIPRSAKSLLTMGSVALYYDNPSFATSFPSCAPPNGAAGVAEPKEMPIAWGFLGLDGSICTLHVEDEHRGKGLAVLVGREVLNLGISSKADEGGGGLFSSGAEEEGQGQEWAFADVALDNVASRRVMEKMGGVEDWKVVWVVVEVTL